MRGKGKRCGHNVVLPALLLVALGAAGSVAQDPEEEERPRDDAVLDSGLTERVQVFLRRADFLVVDKKGRPVTDLRLDEVRLWDDGEPQKLLDLLPVHRRRPADALPEAVDLGDQPIVPLPQPPAERAADEAGEAGANAEPAAQRRWIILYFDANNLSLQGRLRAGQAVRELVEQHLGPEDRVALFVDEDDLRIVVPFAKQREILLNHLSNPEGLTQRSRDLERRLRNMQETAEECRDTGTFQQMADCAMQATSLFVTETVRETELSLDHLEALLRSLGAIPDRKILFWISDGILVNPGDVAVAATEHAIGQFGYRQSETTSFLSRDYTYRLDGIYQLATEARTGIYPVNTLRKMIDDLFAPEKRLDGGPDNVPQARMDPLETSWRQVTKVQRDLARSTGGVPVFKQDPAGLLGQQLASADGVYTTSYYPTSGGWGKRKIRIKVDRKGARVYYKDQYRHVAYDARRLDGELVVEANADELDPNFVRARVRVLGGEFSVAPDSEPPASVACFFFELRSMRGEAIQDHFEVIAFPRPEELENAHLERPFAVRVPPGDYVLQVEVRDVHGPAWGSFVETFSVGATSDRRTATGAAAPGAGS